MLQNSNELQSSLYFTANYTDLLPSHRRPVNPGRHIHL